MGEFLSYEQAFVYIPNKDEDDASILFEISLRDMEKTIANPMGGRYRPKRRPTLTFLVVEKLQRVIAELGITFDDVVLLWNRCAHLDEIEEAVLMTRSRDFGLTRPLAEAVLEVVETDPNPAGAALEYIVVAKLPRPLAEVRALA